MKADEADTAGASESSRPATFYVREPGIVAVTIVLFVGLGAVSVLTTYGAVSSDGPRRIFFAGFSAVLMLVTVGIPLWTTFRSRRDGKIVIDPVRGEIRMSRDHEIPFSQVRKVEVVQHEYTYVGAGLEGGSVSADITGWGIDIGGGSLLFAENGLSRKRVAEIADALKVRVEAYRARTGQVAAPLPGPTKAFLERLATSLRHEGETFQENWLALDGPMVELMREFNKEPGAQTMGRDGDFAQALRKAGFDLGDAPVTAPPGNDAR